VRWLIAIFSISIIGCAAAATKAGQISGVIFGPDGLPLSRCLVEASSAENGSHYQAVTSGTGAYSVTLPTGMYDVTVTFPTLKKYEAKNVSVQSAVTLRLDVRLDFGGQLGTPGEGHEYALEAARLHPPSGPTPRTRGGKPDLSGVWTWPFPIDMGQPRFLPAAERIAKQRMAEGYKNSPEVLCQGHHLLWSNPRIKMVQTPTLLILMFEDEEPGFRQIFLDGRPHPKDPNPTWTGHAVAKWEGDTLVVDRIGFNDRGWLDNDGHPHSEKLHVIERYRRPDRGHLEIEITVDDPEVLAGQWTIKKVSILSPNDEIQEYLCNENNRDAGHIVGK
jgi:hypothetical protein